MAGIFRRKKTVQAKVDYSFGLKDVQKANALLSRGKYPQAEAILAAMGSDELTVALDYIGLDLDGPLLQDWCARGKDKDIAVLALGVYYLHKAWIYRTHGYAHEVTDEGFRGFAKYLELALAKLLQVGENSRFAGEAHSRLIRVYMAAGGGAKVNVHFHKATTIDRNMVWTYIHYCEAIQPKWGGSIESIASFRELLPDVPVIRAIVELKLVLDGIQASENYFGGTMEDLQARAQTLLTEMDERVSRTPFASIHRYIVYNYLYALAVLTENVGLEEKYEKMMEGYYTLYPFGIVR